MRGSVTSLTYCARPCVRRARFGPRHRAADVGVGPVERGEGGREVVDDFHRLPPARACATAFDRIDDGLIAGAAAVVAGEMLADLLAARHLAVAPAVPARSAACRACRSRIAARCASRTRPADRRSRRCRTRLRWSRRLAPSHCTASIRQPRTITPSTRTVQAPQTPCSQPTWLPVSDQVVAQEIDQALARLDGLGDGLAVDGQRDVAASARSCARLRELLRDALEQHAGEMLFRRAASPACRPADRDRRRALQPRRRACRSRVRLRPSWRAAALRRRRNRRAARRRGPCRRRVRWPASPTMA